MDVYVCFREQYRLILNLSFFVCITFASLSFTKSFLFVHSPISFFIFPRHSWAEVRSPGFLHFYKDKKAANEALARSKDPSTSTDKDAVVIDLKNVVDFTIPDRKGKDNFCVDLELGHNSVRVK